MANQRRLALNVALVLLCGMGASSCSSAAPAAPETTGAGAAPTESAPSTTEPSTEAGEPTEESTESTVVAVTYAGWQEASASVEVGGYVSAIEDDGTCTLVLTQGTTSVTTTSPGTPDAASTSCGTLAIAGTDLSPGTWVGVLQYESPRTAAESPSITIEVPR